MNTQTNDTSLDSLRSELVAEFSGGKATAETTTSETEKKPKEVEGSTTEPDKKDSKVDDKAKETTTEKPGDAEGKKPEETEDGKRPGENESDYAKAKKDKERFRVNWSELEKGKTELKAAQAELEKTRLALEQRSQQIEQDRLRVASQTRKTSKYTPEQLEAYAKEFAAEGRDDLAQQALAKAKELREAAGVEQQQATKQRQELLKNAVTENWTKAQADFPDVAVKDSPLQKRAQEVFATVASALQKQGMIPAPSLHYLAVQHADALLKAEAAKSEIENLTKRVTELETENKRLTKTTALPGAKPSAGAPAAKDFSSLSLKDQQKQLKADFAGS